MKQIKPYLMALAPPIFFFSWWQLANWAYQYFSCEGGLKNLQPCLVGAINIVPFLGIGLFWCRLALFAAVPLSVFFCAVIMSRQLGNNARKNEQ